jgi:hypothetical protein
MEKRSSHRGKGNSHIQQRLNLRDTPNGKTNIAWTELLRGGIYLCLLVAAVGPWWDLGAGLEADLLKVAHTLVL